MTVLLPSLVIWTRWFHMLQDKNKREYVLINSHDVFSQTFSRYSSYVFIHVGDAGKNRGGRGECIESVRKDLSFFFLLILSISTGHISSLLLITLFNWINNFFDIQNTSAIILFIAVGTNTPSQKPHQCSGPISLPSNIKLLIPLLKLYYINVFKWSGSKRNYTFKKQN